MIFAVPGIEWRKQSGSQTLDWKATKVKTRPFGSATNLRLPGWGTPDLFTLWLDTLKDIAINLFQWQECFRFEAAITT